MKLKSKLKVFAFLILHSIALTAFANESDHQASTEEAIPPTQVEDVIAVGKTNYDINRSSILLNIGNNIIGLQQADKYLTNSFSVSLVTNQVPEYLKKLFIPQSGGSRTYTITAAQYMYTPENLKSSELQVNDRPYAGWLFVRIQSSDRKDNHLIVSGFDAGVVGPASGAEHLQKLVHELTGSTPPQGWEHQLNNELGVNLFQIRAVNWRKDGRLVDNDFTAYGGATLGNVFTHIQSGFIYRIGYNVPNDMGAMYFSPGDISGNEEQPKFSFYVFTGAEGRLIARNIFLDGNTFTSSHSVDKEPYGLVGKAGIAFGIKNFKFGYMSSYARREFKSQPDAYTGFSGFFVQWNQQF